MSVFIKICFRGGLNTIGSTTIRNVVEVESKNFIFTVDNFGEDGEKSLFDFSGKSSTIVFKKSIFDELLGNGRTALETLTSNSFEESAENTLNV